MRLIATFLSVLTLVYLTYSFIIEQKANQTTEKMITPPTLVVPAYISDTPLVVEQVWQQLKAKRNLKINKTIAVEAPTSTKNILFIGGEEYVLYGVFSESTAPFILLKGKDKTFMKLTKGETLGEDFILTEITHNMIVLTQGDERIEFKLFERKKHADNKKQ